MSFSLKALALTAAVLWGGCFLWISLANLIWPSYGGLWLDLGASTYLGYHGPSGFGSMFVVTLYGLVNSAMAGAIFSWLYNVFAGSRVPGETART
jgi:hypothetical protein